MFQLYFCFLLKYQSQTKGEVERMKAIQTFLKKFRESKIKEQKRAELLKKTYDNYIVLGVYNADDLESFCEGLDQMKYFYPRTEEMIRNFLHDGGVVLSPKESQLLHEELIDGKCRFLFSLKNRLTYKGQL